MLPRGNYKLINELYNISDNKTTIPTTNSSLPNIWGPQLWYSLHNGAAKYPIKASNFYINKMKGFILGIPYILPCEKCSEHANNFIEKHYNQLDNICSGRVKLFDFFVDFHNEVNRINHKVNMSYEDAYNLYGLKTI